MEVYFFSQVSLTKSVILLNLVLLRTPKWWLAASEERERPCQGIYSSACTWVTDETESWNRTHALKYSKAQLQETNLNLLWKGLLFTRKLRSSFKSLLKSSSKKTIQPSAKKQTSPRWVWKYQEKSCSPFQAATFPNAFQDASLEKKLTWRIHVCSQINTSDAQVIHYVSRKITNHTCTRHCTTEGLHKPAHKLLKLHFAFLKQAVLPTHPPAVPF